MVKGDNNKGYVIKNTEITPLDVTKTWVDTEDSHKYDVKVYLVKSGEKTDSCSCSAIRFIQKNDI